MTRSLHWIRRLARAFVEDRLSQKAAAISYFTLLSLSPLFLLLLTVLRFFLGHQAAEGSLFDTLSAFLDDNLASFLEGMIASASSLGRGIVPFTLGFVAAAVGGTTVLLQIQEALDDIWKVHAEHRNFLTTLRKRFLGLSLVFLLAFLSLIATFLNLLMTVVIQWSREYLPFPPGTLQFIGQTISVSSYGFLVLFMMRYLPEANVSWKSASVGCAATIGMMVPGNALLNLYLGKASVASAYGAAGSLVIFLVWIYYVSLIFLLGAVIGHLYSENRSTRNEST